MQCSADPTELCGAGNLLSVYQATALPPTTTSTTSSTSTTVAPTSTTSASVPTSTAPAPLPSVVVGASNYTYAGCWAEPPKGQALPAYTVKNNTEEACVSVCAAAGMTIAGVEYGAECYCGMKLAAGSALASDPTTCSMTCPGNAKELCGGPNRLTLFSIGAPQVLPAPVAPATIISGTWAYQGCFNDTTAARAFPASFSTGIVNNTLENCAASCSTSSYTLMGAEYSNECGCGNALSNGSIKVADSFCSMACNGNPAETCGAGNFLTVYKYVAPPVSSASSSSTATSSTTTTTATTATTTATTATTTATTATTTATTSTASSSSSSAAAPTSTDAVNFKALGCYADSTTNRTLGTSVYANNKNNNSACELTCRSNNMKYAGTEYSSECYCSNFILGAGASSGVVSDGCTMACSDGSNSTCGGSSRIQLARDTSWTQTTFTVNKWRQWSFSDCFVDSSGSRTLNVTLYQGNATSTVEGCLDTCAAKGLKFCAPSYGSECYGAVAAPKAVVAPSLGSSDPIARGCNMQCTGKKSEYCGGASRVAVYQLVPTQTAVLPASTFTMAP